MKFPCLSYPNPSLNQRISCPAELIGVVSRALSDRRGVAQGFSALAWGARGRGFNSPRPDKMARLSP